MNLSEVSEAPGVRKGPCPLFRALLHAEPWGAAQAMSLCTSDFQSVEQSLPLSWITVRQEKVSIGKNVSQTKLA